MALPNHTQLNYRIWHYTYLTFCGLVFFFEDAGVLQRTDSPVQKHFFEVRRVQSDFHLFGIYLSRRTLDLMCLLFC